MAERYSELLLEYKITSNIASFERLFFMIEYSVSLD
jgi:hypothetical protein